MEGGVNRLPQAPIMVTPIQWEVVTAPLARKVTQAQRQDQFDATKAMRVVFKSLDTALTANHRGSSVCCHLWLRWELPASPSRGCYVTWRNYLCEDILIEIVPSLEVQNEWANPQGPTCITTGEGSPKNCEDAKH